VFLEHPVCTYTHNINTTVQHSVITAADYWQWYIHVIWLSQQNVACITVN